MVTREEWPPAQAPPPATKPAPPASEGEHYNPVTLERLVEARAADFPDRAEEWSSYLYFLREHAAVDGSVPASFKPADRRGIRRARPLSAVCLVRKGKTVDNPVYGSCVGDSVAAEPSGTMASPSTDGRASRLDPGYQEERGVEGTCSNASLNGLAR
jgi:hypothetical protein